ncbi:MAG: hypothetical protein ACO2YY_04710 [Pseudohongiellaceae bacterium]
MPTNKKIQDSLQTNAYRRQFIKFLAGSPVLTSFSAFTQEIEETLGELVTKTDKVINVF